jgi:hypothetical protein
MEKGGEGKEGGCLVVLWIEREREREDALIYCLVFQWMFFDGWEGIGSGRREGELQVMHACMHAWTSGRCQHRLFGVIKDGRRIALRDRSMKFLGHIGDDVVSKFHVHLIHLIH